MTFTARDVTIQLFVDTAKKAEMLDFAKNPLVKGFTTNPSLMRAAGVSDYEAYCRDLLQTINDRPISFEVFSDDIAEMELQARKIATFGDNVYVKIPVQTTKGEGCYDLAGKLSRDGIKINFTAIFTLEQVKRSVDALGGHAACNISIFAGRMADVGFDPVPMVRESLALMQPHNNIECIWASTRQPFSIIEAQRLGCHIITVPPDMLKKVEGFGADPAALSLKAVKAFCEDSAAAGLALKL